jgi:hypothetical protein
MAIKVNGTTVINDSRALSNIASVDATTAAAITAGGVGGDVTFLVTPPDFTSPDQTLSTNGTWSRGAVAANQLLWVYMVGGGQGGNYMNGGSFSFFVCKAGTLDGSSYTIGQGTSNNSPTASTFTVDGTTYSSSSSTKFVVIDGAMPTNVDTDYFDISVYSPTIVIEPPNTSYTKTFGGGSSHYVYSDGSSQNQGFGEVSLYAGNGGNSRIFHPGNSGASTYNSGPTPGVVPGGAGGYRYGGGGASGANGNIRIYYI